ncbi:hypothetical protein [Pontibacter amylolyticus]|uniref:Uncharacterized protein n=1 Tax=Pontibacter amylolyticus TaxID=1424080 RepID=A0ABQ1W8V9_9BACT|nr:hypothetical protein [Pontibacter amylolyticus]GGG18997.1 hypothetical protein GCM10011323_23910 [Pontibacter amylolyticus]
MRKVLLLGITLLFCCYVNAQTLITPSSNLWEYNGNIGIGVQTPGVWFGATPTFQMKGNRPTISITPWGTGGLGTIQFKGVSEKSEFHLNFVDGTDSKIAFTSYQSSAGESFTIRGNGNIGIGVASPQHNLHVNTQIHISDGNDNMLTASSSTGVHHLIGTYNGWDPKTVYIAGYNAYYHGVGAQTERVRVGHSFTVNLRDGGLGIGTENLSGYRLAVKGKIRAEEIRVESGWADFVFKPDYRLRPLEEVEQHIKQHGHLPDVPSATEVQEQGVDLGKTDALLLQKIEELTLYLIDQKKEIESLKGKIEQMNAKQ